MQRIASDQPFAETERASLLVVMDMIIGAHGETGMPAASATSVPRQLCGLDAELLLLLREELAELDRLAATFVDGTAGGAEAGAFAALSGEQRLRLVERQRTEDAGFLQAVVEQVVSAYYQDDGVLALIGGVARPPYPLGHEVVAGDLSLLEPVLRREPFWRRVED